MEELKKYLENNRKVEIEKLLPDNKIKRYRTAFYYEAKDEFQFFRPKENEELINFDIDEVIRILVYTSDGVFAFKTKILHCGLKILKVTTPKSYQKVQKN